jgi:hypothetical protein
LRRRRIRHTRGVAGTRMIGADDRRG